MDTTLKQFSPNRRASQTKVLIKVSWNFETRPKPSELLNIKWEDGDFEHRVVRIFGRKTKAGKDKKPEKVIPVFLATTAHQQTEKSAKLSSLMSSECDPCWIAYDPGVLNLVLDHPRRFDKERLKSGNRSP